MAPEEEPTGGQGRAVDSHATAAPSSSSPDPRHGPGRVERACQNPACGRSFLARRCDVARKGRGGSFCSRHCLSVANAAVSHARHSQRGAANNNFKGWASRRKRSYVDRFRAKYPEKARAHDAVKNAVAAGELVAPAACADCGRVGAVQAHHEDYAQPLAVRWVCRRCHRARDAARKVS